MQQKKKTPKFLMKKQFSIESLNNCIQFDFITNYFIIIKNYNETYFNELFIFKNMYLKLHDFKYKS